MKNSQVLPIRALVTACLVLASGCNLVPGSVASKAPTSTAVHQPGGVGTTFISDNGSGLIGVLRAPASLIGNNGGGIISDNGGGVISNNGAGLVSRVRRDLLAAAALTSSQVAYGNARVRLLQANGQPVRDAAGRPLEAMTDAAGHFTFPGVAELGANQLLVADLPGGRGSLQAIAIKGKPPAAALVVDVVSSLTTGYILDTYVRPQAADPTAILDRLPGDVERDTRAKAGAALDRSKVTLPGRLTSSEIATTVEQLRGDDADLSKQFELVKQLLVIGVATRSGTDGDALKSIVSPLGLAPGKDGWLYFLDDADRGENITSEDGYEDFCVVRGLSPDGRVVTISRAVPPGSADYRGLFRARGLAACPDGSFIIADTGNDRICRFSAGDDPVPLAGTLGEKGYRDGKGDAARFDEPLAVVVDAAGTAYVADAGNRCIRKVLPDGTVSTFAGNGNSGSLDGIGKAATFDRPTALALGADGVLWVADFGTPAVRKISPAGEVSTYLDPNGLEFPSAVGRLRPSGIALEAGGGIVLLDALSGLYRIAPDGTKSLLAKGQPGVVAPQGPHVGQATVLAGDGRGHLFVAGDDHYIRSVDATGTITKVAGTGTASRGGSGTHAFFQAPVTLTGDAPGNLYVLDGKTVFKIDPSGASTPLTGNEATSPFLFPGGLAVDRAGTVYVADGKRNQVFQIDPLGKVSTFAGSGTAGNADGPRRSASFNGPMSLALDPAGNLYVFDDLSRALRKISPDGNVTTIGAKLGVSDPASMVTDARGNLYLADWNGIVALGSDGTSRVLVGREKDPDAVYLSLQGLAIDSQNNLYCLDPGLGQIYRFGPDGKQTTLPVGLQRGDSETAPACWVSGGKLWYIDHHQVLAYPLP